MNWFGSLKIDVSSLSQRDFDMILKLKSIKLTNNPNLVVFELVDGKDQAFFLQFSKEHDFAIGDIMKIRSIVRMYSRNSFFYKIRYLGEITAISFLIPIALC